MARLDRRDFFKLGAGAILSARTAAGIPQGAMTLPDNPGFATKHLVTIILGCGARKIDVVGSASQAPFQSKMIREGTLFAEDYGETASLHGFMVTELLCGREDRSQRPRFPTWTEYIRKKTGGGALDFWMLQSVSYHGAWAWDVKNCSTHPDYGVRYGATNLTMNKSFEPERLDANVEPSLGHTSRERRLLEDWIADVRATRQHAFPSTRRPVIDRPLQIGDCQAIHLAGQILRTFKPRSIVVQVLGLDDAHAELGPREYPTGYETYVSHLKTTDELLGRLWADIQADSYLRTTTALVIRPDCGRDGELDAFGQLGHTPGNHHAHTVWTTALGPDFRRGHVVQERVDRRDLAPTLTYLMTGKTAEYAQGHVRTQLFDPAYRLPDYVLPRATSLG